MSLSNTAKKKQVTPSITHIFNVDENVKAKIDQDCQNIVRQCRIAEIKDASPPSTSEDPPPFTIDKTTMPRPAEKRMRSKHGQKRKQSNGVVPPQQQEGNRKSPLEDLEGDDVPVAQIARTNWSLSNKLKVVVESYFRLRGTECALSAHDHAVMHKKSPYVHTNPEKRRKLGTSQGSKMMMSTENCEFLIQHTIRADRANDGFTQAQVIVKC